MFHDPYLCCASRTQAKYFVILIIKRPVTSYFHDRHLITSFSTQKQTYHVYVTPNIKPIGKAELINTVPFPYITKKMTSFCYSTKNKTSRYLHRKRNCR